MNLGNSAIYCLLLAGCASECDIINVRRQVSPDGQRVATLYGYNCHNTTGYGKYVDLRQATKKMHHPGNVASVGPGDMVAVEWKSPKELVVSYYFETPRPGPATKTIDGVTIIFKNTPKLKGTPQ